MKCATSTLHDQLGAHPELFMSTPKEPNFFSDDAIYARGLDWYESLFRGASRAQLCGESSTHYTKLPTHPDAAARLADAIPQARILYIVRHPIDRIVSQYIHEWSQRDVTEPIDRALEKHERFAAYSCYAMQLRPYLERFGAARVQLVFFERLRAEPQRELDRIADFLQLPGRLEWQSERAARNRSKERMRHSSLRDALVDAPLLAALRQRLVPKSVRNRIRNYWQMTDRPELGEATRAALEVRLDAELAELGEWLGVPLDCGNFEATAAATIGDWSPLAHARFPCPSGREASKN